MHTLPFILPLLSFSFHSYSRLHAMNIHEDIKSTSNMQKIDVVLCACIKSLNNVVSFLILWYSYLASTSKRRLRLLWHSMSYRMLKGRSFVESFPFATLKRWEKKNIQRFLPSKHVVKIPTRLWDVMRAISSAEKGIFGKTFICPVISSQECEDKDYQYGTYVVK